MFSMPMKNSIFETPHFSDRKRQKMHDVAQSAFNLVPCKPTTNLLGGVKPSEPLKKQSPLNTEKLLRGIVQTHGGSKVTPSQVISSATPSSGKGKVYNVFTGPVNVAPSKVLHMARGSPLSGLLRPSPSVRSNGVSETTSHNVINIFTQPIMQCKPRDK